MSAGSNRGASPARQVSITPDSGQRKATPDLSKSGNNDPSAGLPQPNRNAAFNSNTKSWVGPVKKTIASLKISKALQNKEKQLKLQNKDKLKLYKERIQCGDLDEIAKSESDDDDTVSVDDEDDVMMVPILEKPFYAALKTAKYVPWKTPQKEGSDRAQGFEFGKPAVQKKVSSFMSPNQKLMRAEQSLVDKEAELELLRGQLFKTHRDNYNLATEIQSYKGKQYNDLIEENQQLKDYLERVMRENVKLWGLFRKNTNSLLMKQELQKTLQERKNPGTKRATQSARYNHPLADVYDMNDWINPDMYSA